MHITLKLNLCVGAPRPMLASIMKARSSKVQIWSWIISIGTNQQLIYFPVKKIYTVDIALSCRIDWYVLNYRMPLQNQEPTMLSHDSRSWILRRKMSLHVFKPVNMYTELYYKGLVWSFAMIEGQLFQRNYVWTLNKAPVHATRMLVNFAIVVLQIFGLPCSGHNQVLI